MEPVTPLPVSELEIEFAATVIYIHIRDNVLHNTIVCFASHGQAKSSSVRLCRSNTSAAIHCLSFVTTCPYWASRDLHSSNKLQAVYVLTLFQRGHVQLTSQMQYKKACSYTPT